MCGRVTMTSGDYGAIADAVGATLPPALERPLTPRFNVAPGQQLPVMLRQRGAPGFVLARWGFGAGGRLLINARAETLESRPTFRPLATGEGRCVVPTDGFFEWGGPPSRRQPFWFHREARAGEVGGPPRPAWLPLAGLLRREAGELHFVIITLPADATVLPVHHRMPAILSPGAVAAWIEGAPLEAGRGDAALWTWLAAAHPGGLRAHPVDRRVNRAEHDDPDLIAPVALPEVPPPRPAPVQAELFADD